jgi:putative membrane protein
MAVMMHRSSLALWAALALGSMVPGHPERALAQAADASAPVQGVDAARFLLLAHSSNAMQARASELVASRDARPEARSIAQAMLEFRRALSAKLDGLARERNLALPTALELEHQTILENLEPLDALELSRRYVEVELQALQQELQIYRVAPASDEGLRTLANETAPKIQQLLDDARRTRQSLGP